MKRCRALPWATRRWHWLAGGILAACVSFPATAWNAGGHRLAASIAWTSLDAASREEAWSLLQAHPDFPHWRSPRAAEMDRALGAGDRLAIFAEASVWADSIRDAQGFDHAGGSASLLRKGFPDMQRRRDWHYVNQALGEPPDRILQGRLHEAIPKLQGWLSDRRSPYRAYALVWLLHLVGDLHQPLHVSTRRLAGGGHDAGGNELEVVIDDALLASRKRGGPLSLHGYWDDLVGPPWLAGDRLASLSARLIREYPQSAERVDPVAWRAQSFALASAAYLGVGPVVRRVQISAGTHDDNRRLAERQIALAGYRLAALLRASLGDAR